MFKLHAAVVHFPIAILVIGCLVNFVYLFTKKSQWREFAFWLILVGCLGTIAGFFSGAMEEETLKLTHEQHELVEEHEELGFMSMILFAVMLLWTVVRRKTFTNIEYWVYSGALLAGTLMVLITAHHGGELVYEHGIGVK